MVPECALFAKSFGCSLQGFAVDSTLFVYAAIPGALPERRKENPSLSGVSKASDPSDSLIKMSLKYALNSMNGRCVPVKYFSKKNQCENQKTKQFNMPTYSEGVREIMKSHQ